MWIGNLSTALLLGSFALAIVVWTTLAILLPHRCHGQGAGCWPQATR